MDGALTTQPMAPAVPPVRITSASLMQSSPARAEATSVITLSPVLARPGASLRSTASFNRPYAGNTHQTTLHRSWAIATGIIEEIYLLDESQTQTLIKRGFEPATIPTLAPARTPRIGWPS